MSPSPQRPPSDLRQSLRWVMQAWVFGALWMYIVTGAALTQLAKQLHMPNFGFGLLAAIPFAGALFQLPASYFIERYGYRKGFFIGVGAIHRGLWIVVALVPWLVPGPWAWAAVLIAVSVSWIMGQLLLPVWVSWMADLVPSPIRGRYFSRRSQLGQIVGMCVSVPVGYLLDWAVGGETLLKTLSVAFGVAGIAGIGDFLLFLPVTEVRRPQPNPEVSVRELIRAPLGDRNFRRFIAYTATLTFGTGYVGQFCWLYVLDVVHWSNTQANVLLVFVPLLIFILVYPLWGKVVDRFGRKPAMVISGTVVVPGCLVWIFVTPDNWVWGYLGVALATAAWPGIEIANFNLLLGLADQDEGAPRKTSGYVAVNSAVGALAGVLSGVFGGAVAQWLRGWHGSLLGWPLTYHGVLFLIASGVRLLALVCVMDLEDKRAQPTRVALRYMGTNLFSNLQQTIYLPGRLLFQMSRWTYRLPSRRKR